VVASHGRADAFREANDGGRVNGFNEAVRVRHTLTRQVIADRRVADASSHCAAA
jgi:hypothetical protein